MNEASYAGQTRVASPVPKFDERVPDGYVKTADWTDGVSALSVYFAQDNTQFYIVGSTRRSAEHAVVGPLPRTIYDKFLVTLEQGGRVGRKTPFRVLETTLTNDASGRTTRYLTFHVERVVPARTVGTASVRNSSDNAKSTAIRSGVRILLGKKVDLGDLAEEVGDDLIGRGVKVRSEEETLPAEKVIVDMTIEVPQQNYGTLIRSMISN